MKTYGRFASAQRAYDDMAPESDVSYLDTDEGQDWLESAASDLVDGFDQVWGTGTIGRRRIHGVTVDRLEMAMLGTDEHNTLCNFVHRLGTITGEPGLDFELACSAYKAAALEKAREMLAEYGEARGQYERENSGY